MPTALVTGAGIRVGRTIALALADAGFDLFLHAHRSRTGAEEVAAHTRSRGRSAHVVFADLTSDDGCDHVARTVRAQTPALDLVVHSAASYEIVPFAQITRAQLRAMLALNLEAPFVLTQALLPALHASTAPSIINIIDVAVHHPYRAEDTYSHYLASKAGLEALTRAWARELGPRIRVNGVAPGTVLFPDEESAQRQTGIVARLPLQRTGRPEDVAAAVVFLATQAPYVTGHILPVDGGLSVV